MRTVGHRFTEDSKLGLAEISHVTLTQDQVMLDNLRHIRDGEASMCVDPGTYVRLHVNGTLMMSDTPMEQRTNLDFIKNAHGSVLIAGLGIGLILENLRDKIQSGEVTSIYIVEKYQDVIDLVLPHYDDLPLIVECNDILEMKPQGHYDTIYFDIWPDISGDNFLDMQRLMKAWKKHLNPNGYMSSWLYDVCKKLYRQDLLYREV